MLNPVSSLSSYVKAIGKAYVYVAVDPTSIASWALLGLTEGEIGVDEKFNFNDFKLTEWTGDTPHARTVDGQDLKVTVPLIWGDSTLYDTLSPTGAKGGGRSRPEPVVTRTALIIPVSEIGDGLKNEDGTGWKDSGNNAATAPIHAIWIHKCTFEPGSYAFKNADGGKILRQIGLQAMFDDTKPEGQKVYTIGDPFTQGITTYRL